ncbi:hypothetical protein [Pseudoalteromonas sp. MMG022]|uniref:hypothetical protein n=1 Tax=Pseudoalteromonas sp. MMG022 TaxID=2909978 RepID=UPI001F4474FB|nr:hypothetical protein [Pseudoalteromonas sp. MMG022]MCF6437197.1 hypothetical protein [Pseudoalteromonas sp. MMG022]
MDMLSSTTLWSTLAQCLLMLIAAGLVIKAMFAMVKWGKKMPKGAFILLAFLPLISLFPIPPTVFKNVEKAKQEQPKKKEADGDGPNKQ